MGIGADNDSSTTGHQSSVVATTTPPTGVSKGGAKKKVNNAAPTQGSKLARPIVMKNAKKLAIFEVEAARRTKHSGVASGVASSKLGTFITATEGIMGVT